MTIDTNIIVAYLAGDPDAAIAAVAMYTHTPIVTRNQKDFKKINDLRVITI